MAMLDTAIKFRTEIEGVVADVMINEIYARSKVTWRTNIENANYTIYIYSDKSLEHDETYLITRPSEKCFFIKGRTTRALLYGAGKFLRCLEITYEQNYGTPYSPCIRLYDHINFPITSTPRYTWRGHQIAYRPKTHSYDATTIEQMKQEILDHVLFGANTIEMIPPKLDDCQQSPHFRDSWTERLTVMSEWCDHLAVRVSLWYPAFPGADWHETFKAMKRLDVLFIPGGDPGGRAPEDLFKIVRQHAAVAKHYFPDVEVWVSSQYGLSVSVDLKLEPWSPRQRLDEFYKHVEINQEMLTGVVYGPWTADTSEQFRKHIPAKLPIRSYPDLCHNLKCQYPVGPLWDVAFAATYHRESINPRPRFFAEVFQHEMPWCSHGAGCYSEGCGDDVNKHVWSMLLWGMDDIDDIMKEYAIWYIGDAMAANIIFSLEENWQAPLKSGKVLETLKKVVDLRGQLPGRVERNWRWQMIFFRAVCDAFLYQYQPGINMNDLSWPTSQSYVVPWQRQRNQQKTEPYFTPSAMALYGRLEASAALLHVLVGMQLDVTRYGSLHPERGGHLELLRFLPCDDAVPKKSFEVLRLHGVLTTGYNGPILDFADTTHHTVAESITTMPTRWLSFYSCIWPTALPLEVEVQVPEGARFIEIVYIGQDLLLEGGDYEELQRTALPVKCVCNGIILHDYKRVEPATAPSRYNIPSEVAGASKLHLVWDVADRSQVTVRSVPVPVADININ